MTVMGLFQNSVDAVRNNLGEALRFSGVVFILTILVTTAINVWLIGQIAPPPIDPEVPQIPEEVLLATGLNFAILFVVFSWVAIEWHRFALGGVRLPSIFPTWNGARMLRYLGQVILLGVMIAFAVAFPFAIVIGIFQAIGLASATAFLPLVMIWVAYYVIYRAGMVLPAAALDQPLRLRDSMNMTKDMAGPLWGLAGLQLAISVFFMMLVQILPAQSIVGVVVSGVVQWFLVLLSASLLSSVYKATQHNQ